ncbi:putative WRKY transcription factor 51 [Acorus gramineus]|uniref:WRKY transcription factor 51 n=1 Tax=Acorus gramineus TaxID=55184 RepID=A0AAV8ZVY2_ACOGR|nr:putative WRKY transcription factor 51 [Acorus gramineus]KAK1259098.1 putative WRKY transcription factor 51 [Acorus gramineus]
MALVELSSLIGHHMSGNSGFDRSLFEFEEYLMCDEGSPDVIVAPQMVQQQIQMPVQNQVPIGSSMGWSSSTEIHSSSSNMTQGSSGMKKMKVDGGSKIAFRTKSEVEILEDGYKWRKYGKKSVKNSPNPRMVVMYRNYYRCSAEGCNVKKRVERDREDNSYVITTYDGVHNHISPGLVYYDPINASYLNPPHQPLPSIPDE